MNVSSKKLLNYIQNFSRYGNYSYKPIKRPNINVEIKRTAPPKSETLQRSISIAKQLEARILSTGPISIADYMKEVLTNPSGGYYMHRDVFGFEGDFITSPEILQIFGELVGIWCLTEWQKIGSPSPLQIIELGPGRGTLTRDILRVISQFNLKSDISFHLVEISPFLSKIQAQKLCYDHDEVSNKPYYRNGETVSGIKIYWYQNVADIPRKFSIVLANEFFDALPIHKFQKDSSIWKEILIDIDVKNKKQLRYVISKFQTPHSKIYQHLDGDGRECLEYSFETAEIVNGLSTRLEEDGGIVLIMDYGHFGEKTDTFRAFKNHKLHDPLNDPGLADLTADVDFSHIKYIAEKDNKVITFGPVEQGSFLRKMESEARLEVLLNHCLPEQKEQIKCGYHMLIDDDKMGKRFKFFSMFPKVLEEHLAKLKVSGFS